MILIADSGSTKTDWGVVDQDTLVKSIQTSGLNPFFLSEEELDRELVKSLLGHIHVRQIDAVYFYGAGCVFEKADLMHRVILRRIQSPVIEVNTDLLAAARSVCGNDPGIACIMGTGSNSCFYDGDQITRTVSPLGYILGDEGSGADLGKQLVKDLLKDMLTPELKEAFLKRFDLTLSDVLNRVYRQPFPNNFLASFSPFLFEHINDPCVHNLVLERFKSFIERNVMKYDYQNYPVHFVGSIAFHYKHVLQEAADDTGIQLGTVIKRPMGGLVIYHCSEHVQPPIFFDI
jgi:N-acetylglucosamine kinase-like BadF-type ATPase